MDVIATVPAFLLLLMHKHHIAKYFMLVRYSHFSACFNPIRLYFDKVSKSTKVQKAKFLTLAQVFIFILMYGHFLSCMWVILGGRDPVNKQTWIYKNEYPEPYGNVRLMWCTSFYWVFEVLSTAGYGDFMYSSNAEYLFAILLEFSGVSFNAILVGTVSGLFDGDLNFELLMSDKMDQLLMWVKKIENCNKFIETRQTDKSLEPKLYSEINRFVQDAFLYDFNLIVEEFNMY